jgi:hypothetical protein
MFQQSQQISQSKHDEFLTSINMAEAPLCAMQVLGNKLLRRPDLLVVLQGLDALEVVRSAIYDFAG